MNQVNVRLNDDDAELIRQLARDSGRSVANYVRRVVVLHLDTVRAKNVPTRGDK
jgi:uncharacterized protein (DUF1778 family)